MIVGSPNCGGTIGHNTLSDDGIARTGYALGQGRLAVRRLRRFEGFTDAVFAIALTLLIVEIKPPAVRKAPPYPETYLR